MLIWILTVFILGVVALLGFYQGAIALLVSLAGLLLGAALAFPLGPSLKPLVVMAGAKSPIWLAVLPPIIVFLLFYVVFAVIGFVVHRKVALHYKYKTDDVVRLRWERMNRAIGLGLGLVAGTIWLFAIGLAIYVGGYFTAQVGGEESNNAGFKYLSKARQDLVSTGLDKSIASLDRAPALYYQTSDILGLIYHNPILVSRLADYPPFLQLGERAEFQELAKDTEFNNLFMSKGDAAEMIGHPKIQAIVLNEELVQELLKQDMKDLKEYLETGVSPKYSAERILGRWHLDAYASLAQMRKKKPDMPASEMVLLRKRLSALESATSFTATTDNKAILKINLPDAPPPSAVVAATAAPATPQLSPELAQRYGVNRGGNLRPTAAAPVAAAPPAQAVPLRSSEGAWQREGSTYHLSVKDDKGKESKIDITADEGRLLAQVAGVTLVFERAE